MDLDKELEELLNDPLLNVGIQEQRLFDIPEDMKRVMEGRRLQPDHYAQRKICEDFHLYKQLFEQVQHELKGGKRTLIKTSKTSNMKEGHFYVVDGMLVLLHSIAEKSRSRSGMIDGRTRCIYENGTESDILLETLRRNVLHDGYAVTEPEETNDSVYFTQQKEEGDRSTGYVYVLKSLSTDSRIAGVKDLYKIGFTESTVEQRTKNAENEFTYLKAPVKIVEAVEIVNMNSHVFETLVHQVFSSVQFNVKFYDEEGQEHTPSEWYVVPLEVINLVIRKIADGSITQYSYNPKMQCLEKVVRKKTSTFNTKGLKVLTLIIKESFFKQIISGEKTIEYRQLKQSMLNKYTYVDETDGKRHLRWYDVIRFYVGYHKDRDSALVEVKEIKYDSLNAQIEFHLGRILEHISNKE